MQYSLGPAYSGKTAEQAVAEGREASLIPAGDYVMALTAVELSRKQRKDAADGVLDTLFKMTFSIQEGNYAGRTLFKYIGVDHGNANYMASSLEFVGTLAIACGHKAEVTSLDPFLHRPVIGKVAVSKDRGDGYGPSNDIRSCKAHSGYAAAPPAGGWQAPAQSQPAAAPAAAPPPAQQPAAAAYSAPPAAAAQPAPQMPPPPPQQAAPALAGGGQPPWKS